MKIIFCLSLLIFLAFRADAQTGALIALPGDKPDEKMLSIQTMNIQICADNQTAKVRVTQIYRNHTAQTLEGKYVFALPETASVSDFAVWDGAVRIPGVMMERRRAGEIYGEIVAQRIDPGILQTDEVAGGKNVFSARVFPIPPYGTKRVEIEYRQELRIENFTSRLSFPLKPSFGEPQRVENFSLSVCAYNEFPLSAVYFDADKFPLQVLKHTESEFAAEFAAANYRLEHDFALDYRIGVPHSLLSFIAYRAPESISAFELRDPALAEKNRDGYFEMRAVFNEPAQDSSRPPRRLILMVDTSLSMFGEKLRRAVEAAETVLQSLNERDEFSLILFGNEPVSYSETPVPATAENVDSALDYLKNSHLSGGTNLKNAFEKALAAAPKFSPGEKSVVLVSDAHPTRAVIDKTRLLRLFDAPPERIKIYAYGIGSDADAVLLNELAKKTGGFYMQARETGDGLPVLEILLSKIGGQTVDDLNFSADAAENFYEVYSTGEHGFNGSSFSFIGRYREPRAATLNLQGAYGARKLNLQKQVDLPAFADFHAHLPQLWAQARIDWLVKEMNLNGEREDYIAEIIALSQKYKIVSPYTAFIAAPRALLRPRLIQPGDPVIRVKTDPSVTAVFAVLPFGETLPLKFLESEGVWETRFLAPVWMADGTYNCRLLLTDKNGNGYEETKTFVVDSSAPALQIELPVTSFRSGEAIEIRVDAPPDTANLTAKLPGAKPVRLFWSAAEKTNVGTLALPANLAAGEYVLTISAEDFARNHSSEEIRVRIFGN